MIKVTLRGKANAEFIVKNPKKIEMWKMLSEKGMKMLVDVSCEEIKSQPRETKK